MTIHDILIKDSVSAYRKLIKFEEIAKEEMIGISVIFMELINGMDIDTDEELVEKVKNKIRRK